MRVCKTCLAQDNEDCKNGYHPCEFGDGGVFDAKDFFETKFKLAIAMKLIKGLDLDYYLMAWNNEGRDAIKEYKKHVGWTKQDMKKY